MSSKTGIFEGSSTKNLLDHLSRVHHFDIDVKESEKQPSIKKHVKYEKG